MRSMVEGAPRLHLIGAGPLHHAAARRGPPPRTGEELARQRLDPFRQFKPAMLGRVAFRPRFLDRRGQRREAGGVACVEVGIVERFLVAGDLRFERVDPVGEEVVVALVLVG